MRPAFGYFFLFICFSAWIATASAMLDKWYKSSCPDCKRNVSEIVRANGYVCEDHTVTTRDGYLLTVQHLPPSGNATRQGVVLLQHGLLDSSYTWVNLYPTHSLAYILADAGFDVWLGNNRGNIYGMRHTSLSPDSKEFWEFSYDEMAMYDMPALVSYALSASGAASLAWVGHSEGTLQAFAGLSLNDTLRSQVHAFIALAPVASVRHMNSPIFRTLADLGVAQLFRWLGIKSFLPDPTLMRILDPLFCYSTPTACDDILFALCGSNPGNINSTRLPAIMAHTPAGTSVQNMLHWAQAINDDGFRMMDFGTKENTRRYGQPTPPSYNLARVGVPISLFTGSHDVLADPTDVAWLRAQLGDRQVVFVHNSPTYEHLDFVWGSDAAMDIYPLVVAQLRNATRAA